MENQLTTFCKRHRETISYLIFGFATTVVNWTAYAAFVKFAHMSIFWSNVISWALAVLFAFITNKLWVFMSKSLHPRVIFKEFVLFLIARLGTGALEVVAVPGLVHLGLNQSPFGVNGLISKIVVSIVVIILNYILSKLIIFKSAQACQ